MNKLLQHRFQGLAARWKRESAFMSSPTEMVALESYSEIIALGRAALPALFRELERETDHWFFALAVLTGVDPVTPALAGDVEGMASAWLQWGKLQGYC